LHIVAFNIAESNVYGGKRILVQRDSKYAFEKILFRSDALRIWEVSIGHPSLLNSKSFWIHIPAVGMRIAPLGGSYKGVLSIPDMFTTANAI
jgi:hypothetical protein